MELKENQGIPRYVILMMAVMAGVSVANLYYNQPLLEMIRTDLSVTEVKANLITVITQVGYSLGLFLSSLSVISAAEGRLSSYA